MIYFLLFSIILGSELILLELNLWWFCMAWVEVNPSRGLCLLLNTSLVPFWNEFCDLDPKLCTCASVLEMWGVAFPASWIYLCVSVSTFCNSFFSVPKQVSLLSRRVTPSPKPRLLLFFSSLLFWFLVILVWSPVAFLYFHGISVNALKRMLSIFYLAFLDG